MLKIKSDIDVDKLKEFGFKERNDKLGNYYEAFLTSPEWLHIDKGTYEIRLYIEDEYYSTYTNTDSFDLLFDLIYAGLVEKA